MADDKSAKWLTAPEFAKELGVDASTMRYWIRQGHIVPDHKTVGGHARFSRSAVRRIVRATRYMERALVRRGASTAA